MLRLPLKMQKSYLIYSIDILIFKDKIYMNIKKFVDVKSTKELAIGMFYYTSGSIIGPLLLFGVLGYLADKLFNTRPIFLAVGVFIAFVTTNILLFKKIKRLNKTVASYGKEKELESKEKKD